MTTPAAQTATVPADTLLRLLRSVEPFIGTGDEDPRFRVVQVEAAGGWLSTTATDRYALAVAREPIGPEYSFQAFLEDEDIAWLDQQHERHPFGDLTVTPTDQDVRLGYTSHHAPVDEVSTLTLPIPQVLPDWRSALAWAAKTTDVESAAPQIALQPFFLNRLTAAEDFSPTVPVWAAWRTSQNPEGAVVATIGDWFCAVIRPGRADLDLPNASEVAADFARMPQHQPAAAA
ncbi:hypothetical protein [Nocardiopsis suaedae]|uniref:Uncharacterized protein n=1 Tax=Nocardiopsis suaedae TaxID=3018444 RepID=A0ABT4TIZ9_9ACTN|nr:hypothetical protein [Nocardiopsis suaedae]MDA2804571.1 hypothetical protein [Nocardiopsis suaedae]